MFSFEPSRGHTNTICWLRRSGKSSIQKVVFQKMSPHDLMFQEENLSLEIRQVANNEFVQFQTWDFPGDYQFDGNCTGMQKHCLCLYLPPWWPCGSWDNGTCASNCLDCNEDFQSAQRLLLVFTCGLGQTVVTVQEHAAWSHRTYKLAYFLGIARRSYSCWGQRGFGAGYLSVPPGRHRVCH